MVASGICSWIPAVCCSRSWCIPPTCRIARAPRSCWRACSVASRVCASSGLTRRLLVRSWTGEQVGGTVEVVERSPRRGFMVTADGAFQRVALPATFAPLPRRWGVERTLAWTSRYRRMSKDFERLPATSEALLYLPAIRLLPPPFTQDHEQTLPFHPLTPTRSPFP